MSNKTLFDGIDKKLLSKFKEYHLENPEVYVEFCKIAEIAFTKGRERYSAWAIINIVRWHRDIETNGEPFKISNDFIAIYARLLIYHRPKFEGFFLLKQMGKRR